ncbi:hypothetical protein, partial [uncultured Parasutterella sp.]
MKIILALVCFIAMMLHAFFGYFLYTRGETVFEPENMIVAIEKKAPSEKDRFAIFRKKAAPAAVQSAVSEPKEQAIPTTENTVTENTAAAEPQASEETKSEQTKSSAGTETAVPTEAAPIASNHEQESEYVPLNTGWSGFLQVENAIITAMLFFLGFAVCCVKGRGPASRWVFGFNLIFWATLSGSIWFFIPEKTPLMILNIRYSFPQWYLVIGLCGLAAVLSLLLFLNAFRSPIEAAPKAVKEPKKEEPKIEPKKGFFSSSKK